MNSFLQKFKIGEWNLGLSNTDFIAEFGKIKRGGTLRVTVTWMKHSKFGSFFADPFIYKVNRKEVRILAEEYIYARSKGIISLCTINRRTSELADLKRILKESCHLSYPFYDEVANRFYPESYRNGNWASYNFNGEKATDKHIITEYPLIDATPIEREGRWYIFATKQPHALSELNIYVADKREGSYTPHPLNPVKDNIATSRSGGKCFIYKKELYRIVQDSTHRYGEALHITHVTKLSPTEFEEEDWCDIKIDHNGKYPLGIHTLNFKDNLIVVDGYREAFRPFFAIYIYKIVPFLRKFGLQK